MQSYFQYRGIYKQLEKQLVVKHDKPDDVWTRERRYSYGDRAIQSQPFDQDGSKPAKRRREHGQRTVMSGPSLNPRHSTGSHLEHGGDVERIGDEPAIGGEPHTINSRDTLGDTPDMMLTGVEKRGEGGGEPDGARDGVPDGVADGVADGAADGTHPKDKLIVVTFEGEFDPMDPHNWSFMRRLACTLLVSFTAAITLWASTIDAAVFTPETQQLYHSTSFVIETVPTGM